MRKTLTYILTLGLLVSTGSGSDNTEPENLVWPKPPDTARVEYVGSIECDDLSPEGGFFRKLSRWIGGKSADDKLTLPFDVVATDESFYAIFQGLPALVAIDRQQHRFKLYRSDKLPLKYPISLCDGGMGTIFITDSEAGAVFILENGSLRPFLTSELARPTGIAALPRMKRLYVVDTGDQSLKVFSYDGVLLHSLKTSADGSPLFNYPSFATAIADSLILVNDCLNYEIKCFDSDGRFLSAFGQEGDGPGAFSRPKGIAADSDAHIYVVDNLFDNVQIFDPSGQVLLALGSGGADRGQFWSPTGIDIRSDTIFVADTHNNRIQILRYLGDRP